MNALCLPAASSARRGGGVAALSSVRLQLRDGRGVLLRPIQPDVADAEHRFIQALSPRSPLLRFHGVVNFLPDTVLRQMTRIDQRGHVALVAETVTPAAELWPNRGFVCSI